MPADSRAMLAANVIESIPGARAPPHARAPKSPAEDSTVRVSRRRIRSALRDSVRCRLAGRWEAPGGNPGITPRARASGQSGALVAAGGDREHDLVEGPRMIGVREVDV